MPRQNDHGPFGLSDLKAALDQADFPESAPGLIHVADREARGDRGASDEALARLQRT